MFDLTSKVALVAGGAGYLGSPVCKALAEQGATVVIADMAYDRAQQVAAEIASQVTGATLHAVPLDMSDESLIQQAVCRTTELCGRLDILVNATYGTTAKRVEDLEAKEFTAALHVQLTGGFLLARAAAEVMTAGGSIIFFSSMYGEVSPDPRVYLPPMNPNPIEYGTGKAGVIHMTKYLAVHWAPRGIRVNCVSPGPFPNPTVQREHPEFVQRLAQKVPMGRIGRPHEMAGAVVFLASDAASYVTGETISVNGGWTSW